MKKYIFAGLGILIVLTMVIFGFNGLSGNSVKEVNTQSANINFEEMCKNDRKVWMKMMPMINGVPTGNPACYGCMANEDTHFCDKEEYFAFVDKDHDQVIQ